MSDVIELLRDEQQTRCNYGTRDGDGRTCDCKFGAVTFGPHGEQNGCPELRSAIRLLEAHPRPHQPRDEGDLMSENEIDVARTSLGYLVQMANGHDYGDASKNADAEDAVLALLDEVKALRRWKAEATSLFDGMQDLGRALGLPLGTLVTGPDAIEAAEALRGQVKRMSAATGSCGGCGAERVGCWVCRPGLVEVLRSAPDPGGWRAGMDAEDYAHLADVVLAWVAAGLDGAREDVWGVVANLRDASPRQPDDADSWDVVSVALDEVRRALGVPQEAAGVDLTASGRSVGFGDGSDDEGTRDGN